VGVRGRSPGEGLARTQEGGVEQEPKRTGLKGAQAGDR